MTADDIRDRAAGCILGLALGDALGAAREGSEPGPFRWEGEVPLHYTDDTEMTIGIVETLLDAESIDQDHLARRFAANYTSWRGYGPVTRKTLHLLREGRPWKEALTHFPQGSLGNGAAMRAAPVGPFARDEAAIRELSERQAEVTHTHPLGKEGAAVIAFTTASAFRDPQEPGDRVLEDLLRFTVEPAYREKFERAQACLSRAHDPDRVIRELGNRVEALESAPTAVYLYARYADDYEAAVAAAIELGGDTDTIAAMTGAIVGARVGAAALPPKAMERLEDRYWLEALALRYSAMIASRL